MSIKSWVRRIGVVVVVLALLPTVLILAYRFVPPPVTPLMVIRSFDGPPRRHQWMSADALSPEIFRAVMAAEDAKFCRHHGFDWQAMDEDVERYEDGIGRLRGASTITMQTAKNLFLWPGRTFLRKGLEAPLTVELELLMSKKRIIELYLNIVEWGDGIYGVEAAAQDSFGHSARSLTMREAALLAAVLPSPRRSSARHPSAYIQRRAATIEARMTAVPFDRGRVCNVPQDPVSLEFRQARDVFRVAFD
jgi:monofunctional biosynthetic peptidoglycan transglycosylase